MIQNQKQHTSMLVWSTGQPEQANGDFAVRRAEQDSGRQPSEPRNLGNEAKRAHAMGSRWDDPITNGEAVGGSSPPNAG